MGPPRRCSRGVLDEPSLGTLVTATSWRDGFPTVPLGFAAVGDFSEKWLRCISFWFWLQRIC